MSTRTFCRQFEARTWRGDYWRVLMAQYQFERSTELLRSIS